jgi:hypothetical protein
MEKESVVACSPQIARRPEESCEGEVSCARVGDEPVVDSFAPAWVMSRLSIVTPAWAMTGCRSLRPRGR